MTTPKKEITIAFDYELIELTLEKIMPIRIVSKAIQDSTKFQQILSSIKEVGIIEPLVVKPEGKANKIYILLDGHLRLAALKVLGYKSTICLISTDDESYTYNKYINRIAPIQQHKMILRAVERGVPEEKIAKALNLKIQSIAKRRNLLKGICPEAAEMLKDKIIAFSVFAALRKMKPVRQIESITIMEKIGDYTTAQARALLVYTPKEQLCKPDKPKTITGLSLERITQMESEMKSLHREFLLNEKKYKTDVFNHTLAIGYLRKLLQNNRIVKYLDQHHSSILSEFQRMLQESQTNQ
ncbi:MAG: chromosome partitioning protein ParB [Alphaproteobacteria bacterium]|nr:MAG: chromosome partitioning protein ParB [Alphaproteobacteria bacterium]